VKQAEKRERLIPDYCEDGNAQNELIEYVRKRGYDVDINISMEGVYEVCVWKPIAARIIAGNVGYDTLPLAVAMAVGQLIDRQKENKNEKDN
jgi:hypothetical protein